MTITLDEGLCGTYLIRAESGATLLVQSNWDFASLAVAFGWVPCRCGRTDGTIDCPHKTRRQLLAAARKFLDQHIGDTAEDPGYFPADAALEH